MAYLISPINGYLPDSNPLYFFDANAWIAALKSTGNINLDFHEKPYVDFFEAIVALHTHKGTPYQKKIKNFPKFVMCSLLLSEIINAYMRQVAMKVYYKNNQAKYSFKQDYRKTADYSAKLKSLISDLMAFRDYIEVLDDDFKKVDPFSIIHLLNADNDFNDFYYFYYLHGKGIPIVSHDSDFAFQDLPIITNQKNLLGLI
ncbi:MAG TPA: hypothetical protein VGI43_07510 [Mucilaginibacter sp.]|jgi:hypothetical protein